MVKVEWVKEVSRNIKIENTMQGQIILLNKRLNSNIFRKRGILGAHCGNIHDRTPASYLALGEGPATLSGTSSLSLRRSATVAIAVTSTTISSQGEQRRSGPWKQARSTARENQGSRSGSVAVETT